MIRVRTNLNIRHCRGEERGQLFLKAGRDNFTEENILAGS
jgi:hypothetical protein